MRSRLSRALLCCLVAAFVLPGSASAARDQESMFQDDNLLVYAPADKVAATMDQLKALGVDRLRVTVLWKVVAPNELSETKPAGFEASNPAGYPDGNFDRYDTIVRLAQQRGMLVNFNVTAPGPLWATGSLPERPDISETFDPNPQEFGAFVRALGTRYSGTYVPPDKSAAGPLPRVDYWTIWNEPNQPGWLTPQWLGDPRGGGEMVETAPRIYRELMDEMYAGLVATGHEKDTILIGETAPKGQETAKGPTRAIKPGRFIRQLYCLDDNLQFLRGTSAEIRGCPVSDQAAKMAAEHPALFRATGYAHHPYELSFAPDRPPRTADNYTTANLDSLSNLLRRIYQRFGQRPPGGGRDVPLYLTEFGYQTNPPDPVGVSFAKQAAYNNHAEWLTYRNPRVRVLTQFLLVDDKGNGAANPVEAFGGTFQSGFMTTEGKVKPAMLAYQLPLFLPARTVTRGKSLRVFGQVRPATNGKRVRVEIQQRSGRGAFRTVKRFTTPGGRGYLNTTFKPRRAGAVRLLWRSGGRVLTSRSVSFKLRRAARRR